MFYITQIDGDSIPYDSSTFRAWRAQIADAQDAQQTQDSRANAERSSSATASNTQTSAAPSELNSQAVGLAGASVAPRDSSPEEGAKGDLAAINARSDVAAIVELANVAAKGSEDKETPDETPTFSKKRKLKNASLITAEEIMNSNPVTVSASASISELERLFESSSLRHVPVLTESGLLTGIVSARDFYRKLLSEQQSATPGPAELKFVYQIMRSNILSARPEASLRDIARVLFKERIGALPVVTPTQSLLGLITRREILRTVVDNWPLDLWQDQ